MSTDPNWLDELDEKLKAAESGPTPQISWERFCEALTGPDGQCGHARELIDAAMAARERKRVTEVLDHALRALYEHRSNILSEMRKSGDRECVELLDVERSINCLEQQERAALALGPPFEVIEWKAVDDDLPDPDVTVMVITDWEREPEITTAFVNKDGRWCPDRLGELWGKVTHWAPMLKGPKP